jgi:hypothetical protein
MVAVVKLLIKYSLRLQPITHLICVQLPVRNKEVFHSFSEKLIAQQTNVHVSLKLVLLVVIAIPIMILTTFSAHVIIQHQMMY